MSSSPEETTYTKKIQSIWDNIQKTRNIEDSEDTDPTKYQTDLKQITKRSSK
jgi:hypothetical protein